MKSLRSKWPILALIFVVLVFFRPFLLEGRLPMPSDTIVGLYHPFRDLYRDQYPNGIPFKNFLVTDPVRQLLPWRELSMNILRQGEIPLWNPYNMAGAPLLANFQSAVFYPLNVLFFFFPFAIAWSILISSQPLLAGLFMYFYLRNLGISKMAGFLGGLTFSFSGFSIAWLEWGTVLHVILWLPLILLSIDKIFEYSQSLKKYLLWSSIFTFSLIASFFAGHLQTFFYVFILSIIYLVARWLQYGKEGGELFTIYYFRRLAKASLAYLLFTIITAVQWVPTFQLILESARGVDQGNYQQPGWFIPWQNLAQFIAPDFFGNPATLNYFGAWNYAEFLGYIGVLPLIFVLYAIFWRRDKKTLFFTILALGGLFLSLKNPLSLLPYQLNIPFLSTSQPTRLLGIIDFSLAVLASLGFDILLRRTNLKKILSVIALPSVIIIFLWIVAQFLNLPISKRNLILPTTLFTISALLLIAFTKTKIKGIKIILVCLLVGVAVFDLLRFAEKFTPFVKKEYLFPQTKTIEFLQQKEKEEGPFRLMTTDNRIFPPNFSIVYKLQSVDGYDPLYSRRYGELIAASERGEPNINPPFGFNRIITPHNYNSKIIDLLGVRYVLSLSDLQSSKLTKVFEEGETRVYENKEAFPRAFFVEQVQAIADKNEAIKMMFREDFDPKRLAVIDDSLGGESVPLPKWNIGRVEITSYSENKVVISTENEGEGFLVLTDSFYPTWKVTVDGIKTQIYRTDYNFRGLVVPEGKHTIEFYTSLL